MFEGKKINQITGIVCDFCAQPPPKILFIGPTIKRRVTNHFVHILKNKKYPITIFVGTLGNNIIGEFLNEPTNKGNVGVGAIINHPYSEGHNPLFYAEDEMNQKNLLIAIRAMALIFIQKTDLSKTTIMNALSIFRQIEKGEKILDYGLFKKRKVKKILKNIIILPGLLNNSLTAKP